MSRRGHKVLAKNMCFSDHLRLWWDANWSHSPGHDNIWQQRCLPHVWSTRRLCIEVINSQVQSPTKSKTRPTKSLWQKTNKSWQSWSNLPKCGNLQQECLNNQPTILRTRFEPKNNSPLMWEGHFHLLTSFYTTSDKFLLVSEDFQKAGYGPGLEHPPKNFNVWSKCRPVWKTPLSHWEIATNACASSACNFASKACFSTWEWAFISIYHFHSFLLIVLEICGHLYCNQISSGIMDSACVGFSNVLLQDVPVVIEDDRSEQGSNTFIPHLWVTLLRHQNLFVESGSTCVQEHASSRLCKVIYICEHHIHRVEKEVQVAKVGGTNLKWYSGHWEVSNKVSPSPSSATTWLRQISRKPTTSG